MEKSTCVRCKTSKPLSEFHRKRSSSSRVQCYCKSCAREIGRTYNRVRNGGARSKDAEYLRRSLPVLRRLGISVPEAKLRLLERAGVHLKRREVRRIEAALADPPVVLTRGRKMLKVFSLEGYLAQSRRSRKEVKDAAPA